MNKKVTMTCIEKIVMLELKMEKKRKKVVALQSDMTVLQKEIDKIYEAAKAKAARLKIGKQ